MPGSIEQHRQLLRLDRIPRKFFFFFFSESRASPSHVSSPNRDEARRRDASGGAGSVNAFLAKLLERCVVPAISGDGVVETLPEPVEKTLAHWGSSALSPKRLLAPREMRCHHVVNRSLKRDIF